jgi:phosphoesterase RecJ-like protein
VGFRSKSWLDVNRLAANYGGGGHKKAAGCVLSGSMDEVVERVLTLTRETLRDHPGY